MRTLYTTHPTLHALRIQRHMYSIEIFWLVWNVRNTYNICQPKAHTKKTTNDEPEQRCKGETHI